VAQLSATLAGQGQGGGVEGMMEAAHAHGHSIPTPLLDCLRRAIAAGWADQVAHRIRRTEQVQRQLQQPHGKRHAVRYAACNTPSTIAGSAGGAVAAANAAGVNDEWGGDVFLHPRSVLHSAAPEFVVYSQVVRTSKRPYMGGVTAIEPHWLVQSRTPLAVLSPPLADPPPVYRPSPTDAVLAWHDAKYGLHEWQLPPCLQPLEDAAAAAAVFAAALLEGRVVPGFAELRPVLLSPPSVVMRPEMRGVARVGELVSALAGNRVSSLRSLVSLWSWQPRFLLPEVAAWLPRARQDFFATHMWPALVTEAKELVQAQQQQLLQHRQRRQLKQQTKQLQGQGEQEKQGRQQGGDEAPAGSKQSASGDQTKQQQGQGEQMLGQGKQLHRDGPQQQQQQQQATSDVKLQQEAPHARKKRKKSKETGRLVGGGQPSSHS